MRKLNISFPNLISVGSRKNKKKRLYFVFFDHKVDKIASKENKRISFVESGFTNP